MPGTVKIGWHDGATRELRYNDLPVVNEPEAGYEPVSVSTLPASSSPAPIDVAVAVVEPDMNVRYHACRPGETTDADPVSLADTGFGLNSIGVAKAYAVSFVEV